MTHDRFETLKIWQRWFSEQGIPSFPLFGITNGNCRCREGANCRQPGKHPKARGWRTVEADSFVPVGPLDNLGVSTDRLVVVDIDSGPIPDDLPDTFTVQTARGHHLWYWADPNKRIGNATGWRPKIDIRSVGGLVAAPGSRHQSGAIYTYISGEIGPCPEVITQSTQSRVERRRSAAVETVPGTTEDLVRPLIDGMIDQVLAAPQGNRNATFFKVMCRYFELARSGWAGEDSLRDLYRAAIQVGLGHGETQAAIESASRSLTE